MVRLTWGKSQERSRKVRRYVAGRRKAAKGSAERKQAAKAVKWFKKQTSRSAARSLSKMTKGDRK